MNKGVGIGDLIVLVTAIGTGTYVMGLIAVAWSIYARITNDASITWYAVALIPKTVVAAQGVFILFSEPLVQGALGILFIVLISFYFALIGVFVAPGVMYWAISVGSLVVIVSISVWVTRWTFDQPGISWLLSPDTDNPEPRSLKYITHIVGYGMLLYAAGVCAPKSFNVEWISIIPQVTVYGKWIFLVGVLLFIGNFLIGLPTAASIDPPLPKVEIARSDESQVVIGRLIAHVDGFGTFSRRTGPSHPCRTIR